MNEYLIVGAGLQGEAIAYDVLKFDNNSRIILADKFPESAVHIKNRLKSSRAEAIPYSVDASDIRQMIELMNGKNIAIGAASYAFNELLTKAAIASQTNFIDLGGNNTVVEKQFMLSEAAKRAGITVITDTGVAPGANSAVVKEGENIIGSVKYVHSFCGGLPIDPVGELKYMSVFNTSGLINEYIEPVEVLDNYKLKIVEPLTGIEDILIKDDRFPDGKLLLEAAFTSGGSSTLAKTYEGKIKSLDYKTLRYPGHWDRIRMLYKLGFFGQEEVKGIKPREISEYLIEKAIKYDGKDMLILKVRVGNDREKIDFQVVDFYNDTTKHSAMQRMTGYSAAIVAEMIVNNVIREKGVLKIEESVSPVKFINAWKERDINLEITHTKKID